MLGRLLHLGSGSSATTQTQQQSNASRPVLSLESVQEDIHTRNLLFPDAEALYQHRNDQVFPLSTNATPPLTSTANTFDYSEDVDLDVRDVRVLIMQDTLGSTNTSLLFDSHHPPDPPAPERSSPGAKKPPTSPRKGSQTQPSRPVVIQTDSPQPRQGAFDRRASMHSRSQSNAETDGQRAAREYREELATFSSCIFGNSELMAYKGTSTKVHVVPTESRNIDHANSSFGDGRSSIGRSSGRSSKLSQSYSSQVFSPPNPPTVSTPGIGSTRSNDRRKVLITRLFPVNLSPEDVDPEATPQSRFSDENSAFPFPPTSEESAARKKTPQPKQRRTPMYAVVLVVQLPPASSRLSSAVPPKSGFRESGSYNDGDFFPSSYSSARAAGWNMSGSGVFGEAGDSSYSVDVEDRIDSLTQHWDIIMRTLTHLQSLVATSIYTMLRRTDASSPGSQSTTGAPNRVSRAPSVNERRGNDMPRAKPPKSTTKLVSLLPNCLTDDVHIAYEIGLARSRIVMGLSAARVITGQGRWGIWRDEAIWTSKWAASTNHGSFFCNLLTGFLATHTDWLQALCSPAYRRRAILSRRTRDEEDMSLPARTIIVSDDKMAARRMIFLLSAFLPSNQQLPAARAHRPSTSTSLGTFSNSPPTYIIPVLREESLRRKINRRSGLRRASHSRTTSQSTKVTAIPTQLAHLSMEQSHHRRASDAASIRTMNLPMPGSDLVSRKSSAATTATILPETTTPHFSSVQRGEAHRRRRPESSDSVAADDLMRSLKRGESSGNGSMSSGRPTSQGLKWGNLVSGLWNARRRDSMESSTQSQASDLRSPVKPTFSRNDKLFEMVRENSLPEEEHESDPHAMPVRTTFARDVGTPRDSVDRAVRGSFTQPDRTPDPTGAFESPVKTTINAYDGVIDVDVPFPDYMASFESAISSPSSSGYLSTPGLPGGVDSFEQAARISIDGDLPLNSAGWLNRFHPDFTLQAIPPQDHLMEKVKASLRAEPTPPPAQPVEGDVAERWVDVSSVVIADTTTNSITRVIYRRLVRPRAPADKSASSAVPNFYSGVLLTPSILPYETPLEEEWIEEPIVNFDEALAEALEKVVHQSPDLSRESSAVPSQAPSVVRDGGGSDSSTIPDATSEVTQLADHSMETPRVQCKTVMLSALEETIRDVMDHRDDSSSSEKRTGRQPQNVLRDAVRQWVANLDSLE